MDDSFIYNAAGDLDLNRPNQEAFENLAHDRLTVEEAIELTINRHFLTNLKQETDLFPYNYKYTEKKPMNQTTKQKITPAQWESIVSQRIVKVKTAWNAMAEENRFWEVFNWYKEFRVVDPAKTGRQLFVCKPYWKTTQ